MGRPAKYESPDLRQKPNGVWEVVWIDPATGKKRRKSTDTKDRLTAERILIRVERELMREPANAGIRATRVADLVPRYITNLRLRKPHANHKPAEAALRHVEDALGAVSVAELSQDHIDQYTAQRRAHGAKDSTINKELRMLRAAINDSAARRYCERVEFRVPASAGEPRSEWLTQAEVKRMLDLVREDPELSYLEGFILIGVSTAARPGAITALKWSQVHLPDQRDYDARVFSLDGTIHVGGAYIDFGEGSGNKRKPRFPITHVPPLILWLMFGADRSCEWVIAKDGERVKDPKRAFASLVKRAGIRKRITPHTLKHTAITWFMQTDMPLSEIADLVGTSERILRRVYGHHRPDYSKSLASAMVGLT